MVQKEKIVNLLNQSHKIYYVVTGKSILMLWSFCLFVCLPVCLSSFKLWWRQPTHWRHVYNFNAVNCCSNCKCTWPVDIWFLVRMPFFQFLINQNLTSMARNACGHVFVRGVCRSTFLWGSSAQPVFPYSVPWTSTMTVDPWSACCCSH